MSGHHYAVEGRSFIEVTHLALLGVKIAGPAFWGYFYKRKDPENKRRENGVTEDHRIAKDVDKVKVQAKDKVHVSKIIQKLEKTEDNPL